MDFTKRLHKIAKTFNKSTLLEKLVYITGLALVFVIITNCTRGNMEGFQDNNTSEFIFKEGIDIYDGFYAEIYDLLLFNHNKNVFEVSGIMDTITIPKNSKILDIGSGTGHHVDMFKKYGQQAEGIDISHSMIKKSLEKYPNNKYIHGDFMKNNTLTPSSYSLITCLYFTIYYIKNKKQFFEKCYDLLTPNGYLAIHLVDRNNFDPIIPAGDPLVIISAQSYAKKRITDTEVEFDTHNYKSNFELVTDDQAVMHETIKNKKTGSVRKHEHKFYMSSQKKILSIAKTAGFILEAQIHMLPCNYDNQYIYILRRPN